MAAHQRNRGVCPKGFSVKAFLATGVLAAMVLAAPSLAQGPGGGAGPATRALRLDPERMLQFQRQRLNLVDLTDEQKTKIDDLFAKALEQVKAIPDLDKLEGPARMQQLMPIFNDLREKAGALLTDDQKTAFEKTRVLGQGGPAQRIMDMLQKLDLTDEQQAKVREIVAAMDKKMQDLRAAGEVPPEQRRQVFNDGLKQLKDLLSQEQADKLRDLLQEQRAATQPGGKKQ